jgi:hypothetical protein
MARRPDSLGLFWQDHAKVKPPKRVPVKRTPPERTWELPNYLPNLAEAQALVIDEFNDIELCAAANRHETLTFDLECYPNYVLFLFRSRESKKCIVFELSDLWARTATINTRKLEWVLTHFRIVTFNGWFYDVTISALAIAGKSSEQMWMATCMLIRPKTEQQLQPKDVYKAFKVKAVKMSDGKKPINHIDLFELTANTPGLKKCAARLHAPRLQDLPFKPGMFLNENQALITKWYCFNDLDNTDILMDSLSEEISIREETGKKYSLDLRSKSDAQMAEALIKSEIMRRNGGFYPQPATIDGGTTYQFKTPKFIKYQSDLMNWVLQTFQNAKFVVSPENGSLMVPDEISNLCVQMGSNKYQFGIGGLHSQEESIAHYSDEEYLIIDTDATSYYPFLILNAGITPANLGRDFLVVYEGIVVARVNAKVAGQVILALCLKIVVNGTFGKLGSKWSIMYAPDLMLQTTVTGQLSIAMLAETLELMDMRVLSINTDGIVTRVPRRRLEEFNAAVKNWEKVTGFKTEEVRYKATFSKDINNYIAIYEEAQKGALYKGKGLYAKTSSSKNAINEICIDAVTNFLLNGKPLEKTIYECRDIRRFTSMRQVDGGAVVNGVYLGKVVRWYYALGEHPEIIYAKTGNRVARTTGSVPLMNLPKNFPQDVNYDWYLAEAQAILRSIGQAPALPKKSKLAA